MLTSLESGRKWKSRKTVGHHPRLSDRLCFTTTAASFLSLSTPFLERNNVFLRRKEYWDVHFFPLPFRQVLGIFSVLWPPGKGPLNKIIGSRYCQHISWKGALPQISLLPYISRILLKYSFLFFLYFSVTFFFQEVGGYASPQLPFFVALFFFLFPFAFVRPSLYSDCLSTFFYVSFAF